ncbi:MAG: HD domain-containing protein [Lachnospiraceae bacterium]|nr:HD domain-containing protein [Lachnospiraceae bacterium]
MRNSIKKQFMLTLLVIMLLQTVMLAFFLSSFYKSTVKDIRDLGVSNMKSQAAMVENYMFRSSNALSLASRTVELMLENGEDSEKLLQYLMKSSEAMQSEFDENFTGVYGYLNGAYEDGSGWVPPLDYDPKSRSWYIDAMEADGKMVLSTPYQDAQTGQIIVSFSKMLSDRESVISLDITMDEVQRITEEMTMGDMGYGFITDSEGMIIAHSDPGEVGKDFSTHPEWDELLAGIAAYPENRFEMRVNGEKCTVFTDEIEGDWHVVIVARNSKLFRDIRQQIIAGILLSLMIFIVIYVLCMVSARRIIEAEESEQKTQDRLQKMNMSIIRSLASTIDAKDRYTSGHSQRVAEYSVEIAKKLGKDREEQQLIYYAGLLHDVGKIRVPVEVINKAGKLTDEEFDQIRIHPVSGFHILNGVHEDARIAYGAKYHHERYDGTGYPNGLERENIPEIARIIAVADAYDAMASDRSYRKLLPQDVVREEILKGKGTQFDPDIAEAMLQIMEEDSDYRFRQKEGETHNILVVEGDKDVMTTFERTLGVMEDVKIIWTENGYEAVDILEHTEISLIMLDLILPGTDGFTLLNQLKEVKNVPVILMTADRSADVLQKIVEYDIDDYLTKPLNDAITKETVHSILHRNRSVV